MKIFDKKLNIVLRLVMIMLVLTLLSTYALTGTYAKYTTSASSSPDAARVAKFKVTFDPLQAGQPITLDSTHTSQSYNFTVSHNSEVAVSYKLVINFDYAINTNNITIKLDGNYGTWSNNYETLTFSNTNNKFPARTSSNASACTRSHTLSIVASNTDAGYISNMSITVVAQQID